MKRVTSIKVRQRKLAEKVIAGEKYEDIASELMPNVKNPRQSVYNAIQKKGTQEAIAQMVNESNILQVLTTESILSEIHSLAYNRDLKPKEREGYLRMLAEYKALLKQVNLNETVTSSDALVEQAEQALNQLKRDTQADSHITSVTLSDRMTETSDVQGESDRTPDGKEVEATPGTVSENK